MKHKTAELEGALLDNAVAMAMGMPQREAITATGRPVFKAYDAPFETVPDGEGAYYSSDFEPSTRWDHGGPLIAREHIAVYLDDQRGTAWEASVGAWMSHDLVVGRFTERGPTPLIAAMRAYVASKLGEEVEIS